MEGTPSFAGTKHVIGRNTGDGECELTSVIVVLDVDVPLPQSLDDQRSRVQRVEFKLRTCKRCR